MFGKSTIIAAIEPLPPGEWRSSIKKAFELNGYHTYKLNSALLVWSVVNCYSNGIYYADGAIVNRLWLSEKRWALSAISKRIYFKEDRVSIDNRPEFIIVNGNRPNSPPTQAELGETWQIMEIIKVGLKNFKPMVVEVEEIQLENNGTRKIFIGNISKNVSTSSYNTIYKELGFDFVPKDMEIMICSIEEVANEVPVEFIDNLKKCLRDRNAACSIKKIPLETIKRNIGYLKSAKRLPNKNKCILFIMPSKKSTPNSDVLRLFNELEELSIPFRRAYRDDPYRFSIPNQLPSILTAAGGRPHRSPIDIDGHPIWSIGLDMGHNSNSRYTNVALTLVDPDGMLIKSWVAKQVLDETIQSEVFRNLLELCKKELKNYTDIPYIVFLRDGRFFENDEIISLKGLFGSNISIFEYRKNHNPKLFYLINNEPAMINKPVAALVPNSRTIFISTIETYEKKTMHKTAKVTWKESWNGLELLPSQIAEFLMTSAFAPGLGPQPKLLPACIYWADGIACTSETDLRFRGQPICKLF